MKNLYLLVAFATIYLPLVLGGDGVVVAIAGHGERVSVQRDFAIIECANGAIPTVATEQNIVIVRCEHAN